jgi:hypothetical protein
MAYNVLVDPVRHNIREVFLLDEIVPERGGLPTIRSILAIAYSWVNQTVPFGFLYEYR